MELSFGVWMALMLIQIGFVRTQFTNIMKVNNNSSTRASGTDALGATVCEGRKQHIECDSGKVINIISASYGRKSRSVCRHSAIRMTNCHSPQSLSKVKASCNRISSCVLNAANSIFGDPCNGTYKYLTVQYQCVLSVNLIEGDIATGPAGTFDASNKRIWPNGVVPYVIREAEEDKLRAVVAAAAADYAEHTCIKWIKYPSKDGIKSAGIKNYIEFFATGGGCWSYIGMTSQHPQQISIQTPGCDSKGIVVHEMLHALGFYHEQSRNDRDGYITVVTANIQDGMEGNFQKHHSNYYGEKYDIKSVMQYGPYAFSKNGQPTILSKEGITNFGQRDGLSPIDIKQINAHYECPDKPGPGPQPTTKPTPQPTPGPVPNGGGTNPPPPPPSPPSNGQCGVQTYKTGKIVGGKNAEVGESGWMVGLYFAGTATPGRAPFCGGTLIRENVVMTAAHCLRSTSASKYEVRIGDHNLQEGKIGPQEERVGLSKIYIHENYNPTTFQNDIALLILNKNVKIGGQVQVACLPTKPVADDATCYSTGWGILKVGGRPHPAILQAVELPLYTKSDCKGANGNGVTEDMICAGYYKGKYSCQGDFGGPLVCKIPGTDRMELRGVTSWGVGCGRKNKPGVYTRVHHFVKNNWINNKLMQHRMEALENEINDLESIFKSFADDF